MTEEKKTKKAKKAKKLDSTAVEKFLKELEGSELKKHKWAANNLRTALKLLKG